MWLFGLAARARDARVTFPAVRSGVERGGTAAAAREGRDSDGASSSLRPLPERDGPQGSALLLVRRGWRAFIPHILTLCRLRATLRTRWLVLRM